MFYHGALSLFPSCTFCFFSVFSGISMHLDFSSSSFSTQKSCLYLLASYCLLSFLLYQSHGVPMTTANSKIMGKILCALEMIGYLIIFLLLFIQEIIEVPERCFAFQGFKQPVLVKNKVFKNRWQFSTMAV